MRITRAENQSDFQEIENLAFEIIPEFYSDIIPHDHNVFFVQKFQTVKAIQEQSDNGYEYYLIYDNNKPIGYIGLQNDKVNCEMILSKLYILKYSRGKGFGTKAMDLIVNRAIELKIGKISLTVNRKNEKTIKLYKKYGFEITKDMTNRFENGHIILDYEMTKLS
jgi:ribosomal protein S18 acetylase RimI-like enzyme